MTAKLTIRATFCIVVVGLLSAGLFSSEAQAQCWGFRGGYYPFYAGYAGAGVYTREYIPYYSLHPPVYYSLPVSRPYGWSPFSWQPLNFFQRTVQPAAGIVRPFTLRNPFVSSTVAVEPCASVTQPLRITNPYVQAALSGDHAVEGDAVEDDAESTNENVGENAVRGDKPLAIYPATDLAKLE